MKRWGEGKAPGGRVEQTKKKKKEEGEWDKQY
jgi:hypothetical protein